MSELTTQLLRRAIDHAADSIWQPRFLGTRPVWDHTPCAMVNDAATAYSSSRMVSVRVTLAARNLGMSYMLLTMEFGMAPMPAMTPMPRMSGV